MRLRRGEEKLLRWCNIPECPDNRCMPPDDPPATPPARDALAREAFGYQHLLTAYAFSLLNNWTEAEDVVQDAILFVDRNPEKYDPTRPLLPWARGIVRIKCLNLIRSRQREVSADEQQIAVLLDHHLDELWDEAAAAEMAKRITALRHCMNELPARACRLLHDFYVDRTPGKDLAERERMNFNNLRSQLHRLRNRLRDCVSGRLAEADTVEQEGYWHMLDEYYGQGSGAAAGMLAHALAEAPPAGAAARQLVNFFLDAGAFATASHQLRPLVEAGAPRRPMAPHVPPAMVRPLVPPERGEIRGGTVRRWYWASAAAAVVAGLAVWQSLAPASPRGSVVTELTGSVVRLDPATQEHSPVRIGDAIPPGTPLWVSDGSGVKLTYRGERGAAIDLFGATRATLGDAGDPAANRIVLDRGTLRAEVAKQEPGSPLRVLTPEAEVTVVGTEFLLDGRGIEVDEGVVRYARRSDGASVDVPARHRALVSALEAEPFGEPSLVRGLVASWKFDELKGVTARDAAGGGHDLRITGADWTRGVRGGALRLRDMAYAEGAHAPRLAITGELTLSAWVRVFRYGTRAGIVGKYAGGPEIDNDAELDRSYALKLRDGRLDFFLSPDGSRTRATNVTGRRRLPTGIWLPVAAVYRPGESVRLYVGGELDAVATGGIVPTIADKPAPVFVGTTYNTSDPANFFEGQIDDVRIYDRALNGDEIALLARYH